MCSLCLYYKISFGQLSMYVANRLRKIPSSGVVSEHNYSLCQCWHFIEQSPSYSGVSPTFHWGLSGKDTMPTLWPSSRRWGPHARGDGEMEENEKRELHFLFSNPQVIVRRKQRMLWHTIQDAPTQNKEKQKKNPLPPNKNQQWASQNGFSNGTLPPHRGWQ